MKNDIYKKLAYMEFLERESEIKHHTYESELELRQQLKNGDMRAVERHYDRKRGKLSDDPLRSEKYLFVCTTTFATRVAIECGMEQMAAYNASDLFIQSADKCTDIDAVYAVRAEMLTFFVKAIADIKKQNIFSKPVLQCIDYIYEHLHQSITVNILSNEVGINTSYLSSLFKKETGIAVSQYIRNKRVEAAENMLRYSPYSPAEISEFLSFSSYSHFAGIFRKGTGLTPKEYRRIYFLQTEKME